ncbi:MAG TPA: aminotransferase class V-fold PLP-dependent enzyme [Thermogutta sp.]|nr:aminotransferase class V-fold PLP-dependent enzyme [Thermogutta sp.]HPU05246.1 aminotransferase class V-fold PLP-dependent enzyme [Thermogutta sp.]
MTSSRIYLDNAATTWPKPEAVYQAVDEYQRRIGCSPGRSTYADALAADRVVLEARLAVARWLRVGQADHVLFAFNGTDALNMALRGMIRPGDHVVTTIADHNSVLRPLRWLAEHYGVRVDYVACDPEGLVELDALRSKLNRATRLVAVNHGSNVTGTLQRLEAIVDAVRRHSSAMVLVDAAQSLGHVPLFPGEIGIDLLAAPGHKGLLGPGGTGILYVRPGLEEELVPLRFGGTGSRSDEDRQPDEWPDRYEPGNPNTPALAGLIKGIEYLEQRGLDDLRAHEVTLTQRLIDGLHAIPGVEVYGPKNAADRVGVVSINVKGLSPHELAAILDGQFHIQVRAGIHCAPLIHRRLGTLERGGAVRFSLGPFNTLEHVEAAIAAVRQIAQHFT